MATSTLPVARDAVTADQLELVKRTVAQGATADELKLFLYDCQRQRVHPLDKLIHFTVHKTKSGDRKYTPVTSIDFMRIRAAETGEYAGSDDAVFVVDEMYPRAAQVTVWRLVQGQRCAFTATARWHEYKPEMNDFMWRKMPHTMLAKCAEALALRKGFPRQLAGLYTSEELDQGDQGVAARVERDPEPDPATTLSQTGMARVTTAPVASLEAGQVVADTVQNTAPTPALPPDALQIIRVEKVATKKPGVFRFYVTFSNHLKAVTIQEWMAALCEQCAQENIPVRIVTKETQWSKQKDGSVVPDLVKIIRADEPELPMVTDDEIPF